MIDKCNSKSKSYIPKPFVPIKLNSQQQEKVLRQYEKSKSCSDYYLASVNDKDKANIKVKIHPVLCHSNFCQRCLKIKRNKLYRSLIKFAKARQLRMMTLTYLNDIYHTPANILEHYSRDWNLFVLKLRRLGYKFNYFKVVEFTKRQGLHYHVVLDCYIPQTLIAKTWHDVTTNSYEVWISYPMEKKKAINYALKYIIKSFNGNQELFSGYNVRRYSFSKFTYIFKSDTDLNSTSDFYYEFHRIYFSINELKESFKRRFPSHPHLHNIYNPDIEFIE